MRSARATSATRRPGVPPLRQVCKFLPIRSDEKAPGRTLRAMKRWVGMWLRVGQRASSAATTSTPDSLHGNARRRVRIHAHRDGGARERADIVADVVFPAVRDGLGADLDFLGPESA